MFELDRSPMRATWGSHLEEFGLAAANPEIRQLMPCAGVATVNDPIIPAVVHSHAYGPLYGIGLSNAIFHPRGGFVSFEGRSIWEFGPPKGAKQRLLFRGAFEQPRKLPGTWTPVRNSSFAHWILEDLPSALLSFSELKADGVLVPGDATGWQLSVLDQIGLPWVRVHHSVRPDHLVFVNKQADYGWPRKDLTDRVVDSAKSGLTTHDGPEIEIFISNSGGKRANALTSALEDQAREMNYVVIRPEEHSWRDQAGLFATSSRVVAPHGGALANLIFCKPGTRVTELMSKQYANPYFELLSAIRGLKYERRWIPESRESAALNEVLA